ncbi:MAG: GNAT family N-acetyltransferase [Acidaminobacteraceae bacterium]
MKSMIRAAKMEDKERIVEISSKIWGGFDYIPNVFDKWINESGEFSVLLIDDIIVAFAKLTKLREDELWLEGIRVDSDLKGRGYGKIIADYQIKLAKKLGFKTLELGTFVENVESLSIIKKRGFEKIISFKFYEIDFANYDIKFIKLIDIKGEINIVKDLNYIDQILQSSSLKEQLNYLTFDWTFIQVDYKLLKKMIDLKALYVYEYDGKTNLFIYTDYMGKSNNRFLSYIENSYGLDDILTYTIRKCIDEDIDSFSYMSKAKEELKKELEFKKFITYTDLEVDAYVYRYKEQSDD